jgi:uncharacterized short protein YbdD (DUF466 family)
MTKIRLFLKRCRETLHLMVGLPDYDRFVAHRRAHHPGEPVPTYAEFFRERQDRRYGTKDGRTPRCC